MPFRDIPPNDPYLRQFYQGNPGRIVFSAHGIWNPAKDGMTRVNYTYYWYTQPTAVLTGSQYVAKLREMGSAMPVDTFGPGSGQVANMLLVPLEQTIFAFTASAFRDAVSVANSKELTLLAFHGNKTVGAMRLDMLDKQLLPAFRYPVTEPVHMVVCRSLEQRHVDPAVTNDVVVLTQAMTPFNSITDKML
jgi:hypothetical protein